MLMNTLKVAALGCIMLSPMTLHAGEKKTFECPASIASASIQVVNTDADWIPFVASPLYLHAAAPMYGPPELRGDLADFKEKRSKDTWSYTYKLDGDYPKGKWLQCTYGQFNQVTLSRRMPDDVQECSFSYRKGAKAGQNDIKIQCK